jgi:hypothetical protein
LSARSGHHGDGMRELSGDALLALPVRLHEIQLGHPADLLLDRESFRAVGLDVVCGDDAHRFLPLPTAVVSEDGIAIRSPLVLLEEGERDFYLARAFTLSSLRGRVVQRGRSEAGTLRDVVLGPAWELVAVIVESEGQSRRVVFDGTIRFAPESRSAA